MVNGADKMDSEHKYKVVGECDEVSEGTSAKCAHNSN